MPASVRPAYMCESAGALSQTLLKTHTAKAVLKGTKSSQPTFCAQEIKIR